MALEKTTNDTQKVKKGLQMYILQFEAEKEGDKYG